jgi:hypothetical protein
MLDNKRKSEMDLKEVLEKVHQEGTYQTIYSYIFNLKTGEITVFYKHNYQKYTKYSLGDLLQKQQLLDIKFN